MANDPEGEAEVNDTPMDCQSRRTERSILPAERMQEREVQAILACGRSATLHSPAAKVSVQFMMQRFINEMSTPPVTMRFLIFMSKYRSHCAQASLAREPKDANR